MKQTNSPVLTPEESRKARQAIGISQRAFAEAAGITRGYLSAWENQKHYLADSTLLKLKQTYESHGYEFPKRGAAAPAAPAASKPVVPAAYSPVGRPAEPQTQEERHAVMPSYQAPAAAESKPVHVVDEMTGTPHHVLDGLVVMKGIDELVVESALEEILDNDEQIESLLQQTFKLHHEAANARAGFFDSKSEIERVARIDLANVAEHAVKLMARNYVLAKMLRGCTDITLCEGEGEHISSQDRFDPARETCCLGVVGIILDEVFDRSRDSEAA